MRSGALRPDDGDLCQRSAACNRPICMSARAPGRIFASWSGIGRAGMFRPGAGFVRRGFVPPGLLPAKGKIRKNFCAAASMSRSRPGNGFRRIFFNSVQTLLPDLSTTLSQRVRAAPFCGTALTLPQPSADPDHDSIPTTSSSIPSGGTAPGFPFSSRSCLQV